jgi:hypothetical protein
METMSFSMTGANISNGPFLGRMSPDVNMQLVATCAWLLPSSCFASLGTSPEKPTILNVVMLDKPST